MPWGTWAKLYEESSVITKRCNSRVRRCLPAQQVQAPESLYRWQWQTGRLRKALGDLDAAITSYRQAVDTASRSARR